MRIQATGPGKTGSINDGVQKLVLSQAKGFEAIHLKVLFNEIHGGNLSFWAPLMWAAQTDRIKASEEKVFNRIIKRITTDFESEVASHG